jgi:phosphomannomutase
MMKRDYQLTTCPPGIFRAYDIRGIVDEQIDANVYFTLGCAIAHKLKELGRSQILVAWDGRLTSGDYAHALTVGLQSQDIEVSHLGLVPTALMYYGTMVTGIDSGLMVTGSHNPKNYNGLKIVLAGNTLAEAGIQDIYQGISNLSVKDCHKNLQSPVREIALIDDYIDYIVKDIRLKRPLKIVADYGHGVGAVVGPKLFSLLGCELINLYDVVDGNFPAHHPDPTIPENLVTLTQALLQENADIGLAFDGDADRLGVVSSHGEIIWPDRLLMLFAQEILNRKPKSHIVYDVKCSKQLNDFIQKNHGKAKMSPTGHSIVKAIMKKEQAELAGEMSGHIFFKDRWFGFDDGIYSACRLLEILSEYDSMQELLETLPNAPLATPEIKIEIAEDKKFKFMELIKSFSIPDKAQLIAIDGIRLEFEKGWGLLRASNTSPCLVTRFEAENEVELLKIQAIFKAMILAIDNTLSIPF